ncbi:MAG: J domain-containing protein [Armatimonadota bacterium]
MPTHAPPQEELETYYSILEIPENANPDEIRSSFRRLIRKWHPDVNQGSKEEALKRTRMIIEANKVLSSAIDRGDYDAQLKHWRSTRTARSATASSTTAQGTKSTTSDSDARTGRTARTGNTARSRRASAEFNEHFARTSAYGRAAAEYANEAADWGLNDVLAAFWTGEHSFRKRDDQSGAVMSGGCYGWLALIIIVALFSGVFTIPAAAAGVCLYRAMVRDGEFIGIGNVLLGMVAWLLIGGVGLILLLAVISGGSTR